MIKLQLCDRILGTDCVLVNPDFISWIMENANDTSLITMGNGDKFVVRQSVVEITKKLLEHKKK